MNLMGGPGRGWGGARPSRPPVATPLYVSSGHIVDSFFLSIKIEPLAFRRAIIITQKTTSSFIDGWKSYF